MLRPTPGVLGIDNRDQAPGQWDLDIGHGPQWPLRWVRASSTSRAARVIAPSRVAPFGMLKAWVGPPTTSSRTSGLTTGALGMAGLAALLIGIIFLLSLLLHAVGCASCQTILH